MRRILAILFCLSMLAVFAAGSALVWVFYEYGRDLPDYRQLADYEPSVMSRVYAGDGRLIEEYAVEGRVFVPFSAIPTKLVNAFLSAEDKTFYSHPGLDFFGIARAVLTNVEARFTDRRMVGASTITQQVAKNFLLTNEYSFDRKIKEAILALRIEQAFDKDEILELYLNEIYFGFGSYGVSAAAVNYFNKSLDELSLSEIAFLAGLPKAPNNYHPIRRAKAARDRRDYVLGRMADDGHISLTEANVARQAPIVVGRRNQMEFVYGGEYFAEEVRRNLVQQFGSDALYREGLAVRTSLDPNLQEIADRVLRAGLIEYDRRHGWRGAVGRISVGAGWVDRLTAFDLPVGRPKNWDFAVVRRASKDLAMLLFVDGRSGQIPLAEVQWARAWKPEQKRGPRVDGVGQVLFAGDVVFVERVQRNAEGEPYPNDTYSLRQIPDIGGGLVALDPHTGRVLAMTGGFSYELSEFNRATQAMRQPGSSFKPFVYLAALDNGYTPSTLVLDAPFVIDQGPGLPKWKPKNYSGRYYGASTLRTGVEKSQNLMTVRLAQAIGMEKVGSYARKFGLVDDLPTNLSAALGSEESTLISVTAAYAMLVNGGKKIIPTLIDRVQDRYGITVVRADGRVCSSCANSSVEPPILPDNREQLTDPASAYQMVSILQGAVERGTGRRVAAVGKPLAGKTGTSNDSFDTWFLGFSPDLAVGVYVGFDEPRTLGSNETGSTVAAPVFRDFMASALADQPATPFRIPEGIVMVRVTPETGLVAPPGSRKAILEAFKPGTAPTMGAAVVGAMPDAVGFSSSDQPSAGGLY
ncbi:MAG: penicillin-binding protein 1A [Rhodospirillaceae bacterium]|nr:penicillin-binding protein 1A [Rhodospirillaceae bacterium]